MPLAPDAAGYYSTAPLEKTLTELVDFSLVNRCAPRLTVGAATCADQRDALFRQPRHGARPLEHVMASGALPPAFPAVRIDGELYWDGGILSNTPVEAVFDDNPRANSWSSPCISGTRGPEPETIWEVMNRQKDIQYSSRAASHIARQKQIHRLRHVIAELPSACPRRSAATRGRAAKWPAMAA